MNLTHSCRSSLTSSIKLTPRWRLKHPRKSAISVTTYSLFKKESMVLKNIFPFFHVYFFDQHYSNSPIPFPSCNSFRILIVSASLYRHTVLHVQHMLTYNYTSGWGFFFFSVVIFVLPNSFHYQVETWEPVCKILVFLTLFPFAITRSWLFPSTITVLAQSFRGRTAP